MSKLDYFQQKKLNPADELREILSSLEDRQPKVKAFTPVDALTVLNDLDEVHRLFEKLEATDLDLASERGRFETIQVHLDQHARPFLKKLGGADTLREHRPKPAPDRKRWWWYIHENVADRQKRRLRQVAIGLVVFFAIIGAVVVAFNTILAPSPEAIARVEAESGAFSAIEQGDFERALAAVEQGLTVVPDDAILLALRGVVLESLELDEEAAESFERAQSSVDDPTAFYVGRGQIYFRTGQHERAEEDARAALDLDNNLSVAWFLLGQALESQGKDVEAVSAYQQAGDVAMANGDNEVFVMVRLALSRIGGIGVDQ